MSLDGVTEWERKQREKARAGPRLSREEVRAFLSQSWVPWKFSDGPGGLTIVGIKPPRAKESDPESAAAIEPETP